MKKILAFLLAAMMVLAFAACGEDNGGTPTPTPDVKGMSADVLPRNAMTPSVEIPADFKIGMICLHDENSTYDNNFIQALRQVQKDLGLSDDQVVIVTNIGEDSSCYDAAVDLAKNKGCKVIFADSFGHESFMKQAAQEYPEVQFCHATGTSGKIANIENFHNAFASIYEGRYLAGIAAGLKLNEMIAAGKITAEQAVIGYVGAFTYAEVISGMTSFYLGARSVCPSATMKVRYTGSWYDQAKEQEAATALIEKDKCVLISQHADSLGAPTACELAGVPNVSYNGSTYSAGETTFIISSAINWAPYFQYIIETVVKGEAMPPIGAAPSPPIPSFSPVSIRMLPPRAPSKRSMRPSRRWKPAPCMSSIPPTSPSMARPSPSTWPMSMVTTPARPMSSTMATSMSPTRSISAPRPTSISSSTA